MVPRTLRCFRVGVGDNASGGDGGGEHGGECGLKN